MWYEIFKFELIYRFKRLDSYLFFIILFGFSLIAFDFIFETQNIGQVKENAPYITTKIMAWTTGIFMMITSMIMGVPVLRDFEYKMSALLFVNKISKFDYLFGRFLGSFFVLVLIFTALPIGMMAGEFLPWRDPDKLLPFQTWAYVYPFLTTVLPILFFSSSLFFVSGAWSKNLIIVYTQGLVFFIIFIFSGKIEDPFIANLIEPFGTNAIEKIIKSWSIDECNSRLVPLQDIVLYHRIFWTIIGICILGIGYYFFDFKTIRSGASKKQTSIKQTNSTINHQFTTIPKTEINLNFKTQVIQLLTNSWFYFRLIIKSISFWVILICSAVIIFINSINLGTIYDVNSYPSTFLIVEELQETSLAFFLIVLVFYSGDLIWKERTIGFNLIYDTLPINDFIILASKFLGLTLVYATLLTCLIFSGIIFQITEGYYQFDLPVYLTGFFLEFFPFLITYSFASFFIQTIVNSKYLGHLLVLIFFISTIAISLFDIGHPLTQFGSGSLGKYSEMNGFGHFLKTYLWLKAYWFSFAALLFLVTVFFAIRGMETSWKFRLTLSRQRLNKPFLYTGFYSLLIFISIGSYIFYNTNIKNEYWSQADKTSFRANYEKTLKHFQKKPQPKLTDVFLDLKLFPSIRDYHLDATYTMTNPHPTPLTQIHIQKWIDSQLHLDSIHFNKSTTIDSSFQNFDYYIFSLNNPLAPNDTIQLTFTQRYTTTGFSIGSKNPRIVYNGTFLDNQHFPALGYNDDIELEDETDRKQFGLPALNNTSKTYQGVDDYEVMFEAKISTDSNQIAIAPGYLIKDSLVKNRRHFHYKMEEPMMHLYSINSARYQKQTDFWVQDINQKNSPIPLEIYYQKGHEYNLDRMMKSMKHSLSYFSKHFSPYQYQALRIVEFPRYKEFAQSFPLMIPFSEAIGFNLNIDDQTEVDIPYFVTAHEVAHQWWGHQVTASKTPGWSFIIESLAQYSALMVLKENYPIEKVELFLKTEMDNYIKKRMTDPNHECPLHKVTDQDYVYYSKGGLALYTLQSHISEEKVNQALADFISDWNVTDRICKEDRYPVADDLLDYFRAVTPESQQDLIYELFETVGNIQYPIIE